MYYRCLFWNSYLPDLISREVDKGPFIKYVRSEGKTGLGQKNTKDYMGDGDPTKSVRTKLQFFLSQENHKKYENHNQTPFREYTVDTYILFLSLSLGHNGLEMFSPYIILMTFNKTQRTLIHEVVGVQVVKRTGPYR